MVNLVIKRELVGEKDFIPSIYFMSCHFLRRILYNEQFHAEG